MTQFYLRVCTAKKHYNYIFHVFGIGHYVRHKVASDEYSRKINNFYLYGNDKQDFLDALIEFFKKYISNAKPTFDCITLYPTHKKDKLNEHMISLLNGFSEATGLKYKQILRRNRTIKENHKLGSVEERRDNVAGSIDILEDVKDKNILIMDNVSITGTSLLDIGNELVKSRAKIVAGICLGLGDIEIETDYDLNPSKKWDIYEIMAVFKSKKVSKEKREQWKKTILVK